MMKHGQRNMKINKAKLIEKVKENKAKHIKAHGAAVLAYQTEAMRQLGALVIEIENGATDVRLDLVTPVNNRKNYDRIIQMFEWDEADIVELTQDEFKEYVLDETSYNQRAIVANSTYLSRG